MRLTNTRLLLQVCSHHESEETARRVVDEINEAEEKARKWDMIQRVIKNEVELSGTVLPISRIDLDRLEQLYKERESNV